MMRFRRFSIAVLAVLYIVLSSINALAVSDAEKTFLSMYFKDEELVVISATRSLKSITRIAENVEVVTKEDIELMNAHTLAEVLHNVNGVNMSFAGSSPGNLASVLIQGSELRHVSVFMDGLPMNNLSNNTTEVGSLPVQHIEKIEVIKGPASSVWGSSLGGVVNIITKSAGNQEKVQGTISGSYGERNTGDFRAELSARKDRFGAYLYAGRFQSDGLRPENDVSQNNLYAKLSFDPASNTRLLFTLMYGKSASGAYRDPEYDLYGRARNERFNASLSLNSELNSDTGLSLMLWTSKEDWKSNDYQISDGSELGRQTSKDEKYGASAKLTLRQGIHSLVLGSDFDDGTLKSNFIADGEQGIRKWSVFVNDTIDLGKLSLTPGVRYDNIDTNGDFVSPSLGMTYMLTDDTLLRAFAARGFSVPNLFSTYGDNIYIVSNPGLKAEQVWSYQAGVETGALKHVWLKLSAFRHDVKDGIISELVGIDPATNIPQSQNINRARVRRQGLEFAVKSKPVYNTTLFASASLQKIEDRSTGEEIKDVPSSAYNVGLKYDDGRSLRGIIQGNYTWFNATDYHLAKYSSLIVNANLIKTVYRKGDVRCDLFFTAHNIFDGDQYWDYWYKNAKRWFEAGVRYTF